MNDDLSDLEGSDGGIDVYPTINCERCGTDCTGQPFFAMTHVDPYVTWCKTCHDAHHGFEDNDEEGEEVDEEGTEGKE